MNFGRLSLENKVAKIKLKKPRSNIETLSQYITKIKIKMCALNLPRINIAKQRRKHISLQTKSKIAFSKREEKKKKKRD